MRSVPVSMVIGGSVCVRIDSVLRVFTVRLYIRAIHNSKTMPDFMRSALRRCDDVSSNDVCICARDEVCTRLHGQIEQTLWGQTT